MIPIPASSPNFGRRNAPVDTLVLHYTGMADGPSALARLRDPRAEVSAHYMVEEDGRVFALVPEEARAWHAGRSSWRDAGDINCRSIGVEIVNGGHEFGLPPYPPEQVDALVVLCRDILSRWPIPPQRVLAHSDVAPDRKTDPGELFPWQTLAAAGVGLWPEDDGTPAHSIADPELLKALRLIGYRTGETIAAPATRDAITAFRRRWIPETLASPVIDTMTRRRVARVAYAFSV